MSTSSRLARFGTTIFAEISSLAAEHGAVNLGQGFPDFEGPPALIAAAKEALDSGKNQYARSAGIPELVEAIARHQKRFWNLNLEPMSQITVTCGATEGIAAAIFGLTEAGDEVILIEPFYDSYPAVVAMAGCEARYLTLEFPDFSLDLEALEALVSDRTRLIILNTPHNPTGKVFSLDELKGLAEICEKHDLIVLSDEVYEHLVYGDATHVPAATVPGLAERTLTLSSLGKTFSFTGWKVGWATGPASLVAAAQAAHQFLTFTIAAPLQHAAAVALDLGDEFFADLAVSYETRRDYLVEVLCSAGFRCSPPDGTYFVLADFSDLSKLDDQAFARWLTSEVGVAAIPPSSFYAARPEAARSLVRFAFPKRMATLEAAAERLARLTQ